MFGRFSRRDPAPAKIPVFHMNSFSRSGETLMLRTLNAHPRIRVVHHIIKPTARKDYRLYETLRAHREPTIDIDHRAVRHCKLSSNQILLLKNSVWEHEGRWVGFILIRNPFSVMSSANFMNETPASKAKHEDQIIKLARSIDVGMLPYLREVNNLVGFCLIYNREMILAHQSGMPIVHYERFVMNPAETIAKILNYLEIEWDDHVMRAHEDYQEGQLGHGNIKLWLPIHSGSLHSYKKLPTDVLNEIYALTAPALKLYGYKFVDGELHLSDDFNDRFPQSPSGNGLSGRDGRESGRVPEPDSEGSCEPRPPDGGMAATDCVTKRI